MPVDRDKFNRYTSCGTKTRRASFKTIEDIPSSPDDLHTFMSFTRVRT